MAGDTGMRDEHFDIVSALYHALQGAEVSATYMRDARQETDEEVERFFQDVQEMNRQIAQRAKKLLTARMK